MIAILPSILLATSASANLFSPCSWWKIQSVAQSADAIIIGSAISRKPGFAGAVRDGRWVETTDTVIRFKTQRALAGDLKPGSEIEIKISGADSFPPKDGEPSLLFLASTPTGYRRVFNWYQGSFRMGPGPTVECSFSKEGAGKMVKFDQPVSAFEREIARFRKHKVRVDVAFAGTITRTDVAFPLTISFKNEGSASVRVIPPSHYFNMVWVRKGKQPQWNGIENWTFLKGAEPIESIPPGESRIYHYQVPLRQLGIDGPGEYQVNTKFEQFTQAAQQEIYKLGDSNSLSDVWLGIRPPDQRTLVVR